MRYALYESSLNRCGALRSTANHDSTSVSSAETGCHWRSEMNGTTSSESVFSTLGQLCTSERFGNADAADTMNPSSPTIARCASLHVARIRAIISSG